jgi:hypothetical protein
MKEDFNDEQEKDMLDHLFTLNTVSVAFWLFLWVRVSESTLHFLEVKVQD